MPWGRMFANSERHARAGPGRAVNQTLTIGGIKFPGRSDRSTVASGWLAQLERLSASVYPGNDDSAVTGRGPRRWHGSCFPTRLSSGLCTSISERARAPLHNLLTVTGQDERERGEDWRAEKGRLREPGERAEDRDDQVRAERQRGSFCSRIPRTMQGGTGRSRCSLERVRAGMNWEKGCIRRITGDRCDFG